MIPIIKSRIAPTPSGYLHLGNAFNLVFTWWLTRKNSGVLRLRIDDLDELRAPVKYLDDIFITLDWLGIDWDEGPQSVTDHNLYFSQQGRTAIYEDVISQLMDTSAVFACSCSKRSVEKTSFTSHYPGTCRERHLSYQPHETSLRLRTTSSCIMHFSDQLLGEINIDLSLTMPDFIIKRKDAIAAYQVASLADDREYGMNMIVRGEDLLASTAAQLLLAEHLDFRVFKDSLFYHHPLVRDKDGKKLSKSAGSLSLKSLRETEGKPELFYKRFSDWLNTGEIISSAAELLTLPLDSTSLFRPND